MSEDVETGAAVQNHQLEYVKDGPGRVRMASEEMRPDIRHAVAAMSASADLFNGDKPELADYVLALRGLMQPVVDGDLARVSETLTAQALTLDNVFTMLLRRAQGNLGANIDAAERYMRLALKAQSQSRATLEAIAKIHQPREQTVRHIHVTEGGQAIIADQFHHHSGATGNGLLGGQPHGQGTCGAAMLGTDPAGHGMPVSSRARKKSVPHARREKPRRSKGE